MKTSPKQQLETLRMSSPYAFLSLKKHPHQIISTNKIIVLHSNTFKLHNCSLLHSPNTFLHTHCLCVHPWPKQRPLLVLKPGQRFWEPSFRIQNPDFQREKVPAILRNIKAIFWVCTNSDIQHLEHYHQEIKNRNTKDSFPEGFFHLFLL